MTEKKILFVDDEAQVRELYCCFFRNGEHEAVCAESAEEALEIMGKEKFYVFFLDLNLPGMDGVQLCKKIRQAQSFAHITAVTGGSSMFHRNNCLAAGFDDYFSKPFKMSDIISAAAHGFERLERWQGSTE